VISDKPKFVYVTYVAATPEKVWQALTDAKASARYLSGFNVALELEVGGASLLKRGQQVLNRGEVLACEPPRLLSVTWRPEQGDFSDERPSRVTFAIEALADNHSKLTITHDDFQAGSKAPGHVGEGWMRVASSLKSFVETGRGMDLFKDMQIEGVSP
jgi:uncharacterized protein YndB with AHSA1/START domain